MREESELLSLRLALKAVFSLCFKRWVWEAVCYLCFWWKELKAPGTIIQLMMAILTSLNEYLPFLENTFIGI